MRTLPESVEDIQPRADRLLTAEQALGEARRIARRDTAVLEIAGHSRLGAPIPVLVLGSAGTLARAAEVREAARELSLGTGGRARWPAGLPAPILFLASNYGNEAAQVEALLQLADLLSRDLEGPRSPYGGALVLIVPLLNPDGRECALRTWTDFPQAPAVGAYGNAYGIQVAREFLYLLEPETVALNQIVTRWHPVLAWEVHEDAVSLGRAHPEPCLAPPTGPCPPDPVESARWRETARYGEAIAEAWRRDGLPHLYRADGRHGWPRLLDTRFEHLAQHPETRFTRAMSLRGVTSFITESTRLPGAVRWEERLRHKVAAGLAVARLAATDAERLLAGVAEVTRSGMEETGFYLLPVERGPAQHGLDLALDLLAAHEIAHAVVRCGDETAVLVPRGQARATTVSVLLDLRASQHQSLVANLGLRVIPSESLSHEDRCAWETAPLTVLPSPSGEPPAGRSAPATGVVAVYGGQGVKDFAAEGILGGVRRALDAADVAHVVIDASMIRDRGALVGVDVLLVPNGDADAILHGSGAASVWHRSPWMVEEAPDGLGAAGAAVVRDFVRGGGLYVGVDAGGARLATSLGITSCRVSRENLGTGLVRFSVDDPDDPVFAGVRGSWDVHGAWREGELLAHVDCEPGLEEYGALLLERGADVTALATLIRPEPVPGVRHLVTEDLPLDAAARAVMTRERYGAGEVLLMTIDPTYRSLSVPAATILLNGLGGRRWT
ncbi:hypothetical protein RB608_09205 [Nocardioides sp. LHD-245]|uniref:hypothetical protein n=1 Tax=Nocardioides sp. LHD-245 TaxID=3051387 RepID=UPI0027E0342E|nr:hypothetical protein [Nocardioides sp. LHD-245]